MPGHRHLTYLFVEIIILFSVIIMIGAGVSIAVMSNTFAGAPRLPSLRAGDQDGLVPCRSELIRATAIRSALGAV